MWSLLFLQAHAGSKIPQVHRNWWRHNMETLPTFLTLWGELTGDRWIPHTKGQSLICCCPFAVGDFETLWRHQWILSYRRLSESFLTLSDTLLSHVNSMYATDVQMILTTTTALYRSFFLEQLQLLNGTLPQYDLAVVIDVPLDFLSQYTFMTSTLFDDQIKMTAIRQTTSWNAFPGIKVILVNILLRVQWALSRIRNKLGKFSDAIWRKYAAMS